MNWIKWVLVSVAVVAVIGAGAFLLYSLAYFVVFRKLKERLGFDRMRVAISGAAPIAPDVLRFFHSIGVNLIEAYGQTEGTGVNVYTHGEMLPANAYPAFKKYAHLVGNYGGSWWHQRDEFEQFGGAILMTTNCIVPPKDSYKDRLFTTGMAGWPDGAA